MGRKRSRGTAHKKKGGRRVPVPALRRMILGAAGTIFLAGSLFGGFKSVHPGTRRADHTDYKYSVNADSSYRVKLRPNALYEEEWLEEGGLYTSVLTEQIEVSLTASFAGSDLADAEGSYEITGVVEGYQETKDISRVIYQRRFPLKKGTALADGTGGAAVEDSVFLDIEPYREAANEADRILGATPSRRFYLLFEGRFQADTEYGTVEEPFSVTLQVPIPAQGGMYEITKQKPFSKSGEITSQTEEAEPVNPGLTVLFGVCAAASLALLTWVLAGTRRPDAEEEYVLTVNALLRKYKSRMIRLNHTDFRDLEGGIQVADMEALVMVADEIHRPLCYSPDEKGLPKDGILYVPDKEQRYIFLLRRPEEPLISPLRPHNPPHTTLEVDEEKKSGIPADKK